ncbi:MAG TPA: Maf family protein, partial [Sphingomonadaceae bacterium]|nr:Maf family protein [Sphingomonadaceae bacterium]
MKTPAVHLASSSPRRRELLATLGIDFSCAGVDIDESALPGESPSHMVLRLAQAKA